MSAELDQVVSVRESAPYRQPAPPPADPPPPPAPPSLDHLFDETVVVWSRWATRGMVALMLVVGGVFAIVLGYRAIASGGTDLVFALPLVFFIVPLVFSQLDRVPWALCAEPAGLRIDWRDRTEFYSWRRVKPWPQWQLLLGRFKVDIEGGPFGVYGVAWYKVPALYRVGELLAQAHEIENAKAKGCATLKRSGP